MAQGEKRSISPPPELAQATHHAAHRLRLEAGSRGIADWEREHGQLSPEELADGLARARALLGQPG